MIELRPAGPADARLLAKTRRLAWQQTYRGIYPDEKLDYYDEETYAARDAALMARPEHRYFLFLDGEACVGFFSFGPYNYGSYRDFTLCLNSLYILEGYKGRGLGRRALEVVAQYCRERGIGKFFCGCNAHNAPALAFYRRMGGVQGDQPVFHENRADDIIHFEFYLGERL